MATVIEENWGISPERVRSFFARQPDVAVTEEGFRYRDCRITLTEEPGQAMGRWSVTRSRVRLEGDEDDTKTIHRRFFLQFLSAGG